MTSGVAFAPEEMEQKKAGVVKTIMEGCDITFTGACTANGLGVSTGYEWRAADQQWDEAIILARKISRESGLDFAEHVLVKKIRQEETACVFYYLDRHGKERGYLKQQKTILEGGDKPVGVSGEFTLTFGTEDNDGSDHDGADAASAEMEKAGALPEAV